MNSKSGFDRDTEYWNSYYLAKHNIENPSLFAKYAESYMEPGRKLIELGCGNGRDSVYFHSKGIEVTAIDASAVAINSLSEEHVDRNLTFVCGDFVDVVSLYKDAYDYCYSRFSIHAISEDQENLLVAGVKGALKTHGQFFIEVRSIRDEIFGLGEYVDRNAFIYDGHYRRFIVMDELSEKLRHNGFEIEYQAEERGFAPFEGSDPKIIRIIAKKND